MEIRYYNEYSQCLNRDMDFIVYGHTGIPILVFPAQDGHCQDYENFGMVDTIKDKIEQGLVQLFCVGSVEEILLIVAIYLNNFIIIFVMKWYHVFMKSMAQGR